MEELHWQELIRKSMKKSAIDEKLASEELQIDGKLQFQNHIKYCI